MNMPDLAPAYPEIFLLGMACAILIVDLFVRPEKRIITYALTQLTLLGAIGLTVAGMTGETTLAFNGGFIRDPMGDILKIFIYVVSFGVFLYGRDYLEARGLHKGEYYLLGLLAILGMAVLVSAHTLLNLYLGLEMLSLSLYALAAFNRDSGEASEAAMKYYVLGAIASGMLLYGMSLLYGLTGSLDIAQIAARINEALQVDGYRQTALVFSLAFVVAGLAFKLTLAPFHMWAPDVYQGAPTPVTLFISSAPKIAAFAMVMRLLVTGMGGLSAQWQDMLAALAVLSIGIGNVVAIAQTNIKRMLAYSTVSHVGFIALGILAATKVGYTSAMFYTLVYALTTLGAFGVILLLSRKGFEADQLSDFNGLNDRHPWIAFVMLLLLASMIGIPGTAGFVAKLSVLQSVVAIDKVGLAIYAVLLSVVGAYYYLRVMWYMYFEKPASELSINPSLDVNAALSINGLLMLLFGIFPGLLMALCVITLQ
ncbi:MAG TPA: NADH-quinone oxidoreductase subunit NuoN [Gammaproteobacteria bacterium]|nr:NADH-quinone oxidoreductase subunit NuoN [Gammaproteobacteria bacterium]